MHLAVEILVTLIQVVWLWLVAIVKAVVPSSWQPHKDITGWVVLITGSGSGLGRLMSLRFAALGCRLVLWDVNESGNQETAELVQKATPGAEVKAYTVDLSDREQIYRAADQVKQEIGDVDILVNNAGVVTGSEFLDLPDWMVVKTMDVNFMAYFWTVKSFLPAMLKKNRGHLVSIASAAGLTGTPRLADYCASKFAIVGFEESIRAEILKLNKTGVKTTVVCPYLISTGMYSGGEPRFPGLMKVLEPSYVADKVVSAVLTDQVMLCLPRSMYVTYFLRGILPVSVHQALIQFLGLPKTMDTYVGKFKVQ